MNDEEDGEEYDEFGEDENEDQSSLHIDDDGEECRLVDKQGTREGDRDQIGTFNSFGQTQRRPHNTTTQSEAFNSDDEEQ